MGSYYLRFIIRSFPVLKLVWMILLLFAGSGALLAQETTDQEAKTETAETEYQTDIVVTGDKREKYRTDSVVSTEVISRKELEDTGARTAAQALRFHPGVEIKPALRGQEILMQGLDPEYVLILIDGERITGRVDGVLDLDRIRVEEIERIEIVKGSASALYGSDAIAGVINIITRKGKKDLYAQVDMGAGKGRSEHFGDGGEVYGSATAGFKTETFKQSLTAGYSRGDGFDLSPEDHRTILARQVAASTPGFSEDSVPSRLATNGNTFTDINLSGNTSYDPTPDANVQATYRYQELQQKGIETTAPRTIYDRTTNSRDGMASLQGLLDTERLGTFSGSVKYNRYIDDYVQDQRDSDELDKEEILDDILGETKFRHDISLFESHFITTGLEGIYEQLRSTRLEDGVGYRRRGAFYVQDEWDIRGDGSLILSPGLRYEYDSQFHDHTSPKLSFKWNPWENTSIRFSAGSGYRAPGFKELYLEFSNPAVGYVVEGNPDLKPETSRSLNLGFSHEGNGMVWFSVNYFYNSLRNQIDYARGGLDENGYTSYSYVNISRSFSRGMETMIGFHLPWSIDLRLGYTYTDSRDLDLDLPLDGRSRDRGTVQLDWNGDQFTISTNLSIYGKQSYQYSTAALYDLESGELNESGILSSLYYGRKMVLVDPADHSIYGELFTDATDVEWKNQYNILDFQITWRPLDRLDLYAGVNNALDAYDTVYNPIRPRFFYVGLRMKFAADRPEGDGTPLDQNDLKNLVKTNEEKNEP